MITSQRYITTKTNHDTCQVKDILPLRLIMIQVKMSNHDITTKTNHDNKSKILRLIMITSQRYITTKTNHDNMSKILSQRYITIKTNHDNKSKIYYH